MKVLFIFLILLLITGCHSSTIEVDIYCKEYCSSNETAKVEANNYIKWSQETRSTYCVIENEGC